MKKFLLLIFAAFSMSACSQTNIQKIAEECLYKNAAYPEHLKILSTNVVLRADTTRLDTFYHIVRVEGIKGERPYEWHNVTIIYTDSVRVEERVRPKHYYCASRVQCMTECGEQIYTTGEVAVFPDGTAILYDEYRDKYYESYTSTEWAQCDTLTNVRKDIYLNRYCGGWGFKYFLFKFNAPISY